MAGNLVQTIAPHEAQETRTRTRDPALRQREQGLMDRLKHVRVYIAGIPVNFEEIVRTGVRALDPNSSYHTEIVEKVKRQTVQALNTGEVPTTTLEKIRALQARMTQLEIALKLSADDVIYLRMLHKHNGLSAAEIGKVFGLTAETVEDILAPKKGMLRGRKLITPMRRRDLDL